MCCPLYLHVLHGYCHASCSAMYRSWMEFWCDLSRHVEEALTGNSEIYEEREAQTGSTDSNIKIILLAPSVKGKP